MFSFCKHKKNYFQKDKAIINLVKKFEIKKIEIENNEILEDQELIKIFSFLLNKNIIFLNSYELKKNIDKNSFIENIEIKKIFPDKIVVKVFEKEPIAILIDKYQKKYYLGKRTDLIEYKNKNFSNFRCKINFNITKTINPRA